jgi:hypothetical protein
MGSGAPKGQPVSVQSGSAELVAGGCDVGPIVQVPSEHPSENRMTEPSGVPPSGSVDPPPPMSRPPQANERSTLDPASRLWPQAPVVAPFVKSSVHGGLVQTVVDVVDVVGVVVVTTGTVVGTTPPGRVVVGALPVVGTHVPAGVQPSPTFCAPVVVHGVPFSLRTHRDSDSTRLLSRPFWSTLQQTTTPLRPHVDCRTKRARNSLRHTPRSVVSRRARLAAFTYRPRLVAPEHGTAASTADFAAANPDVSRQVAAWMGGVAATTATTDNRLPSAARVMKNSFRRCEAA